MGTSHQKGWVSIRGKKWYGYFRRTVLDPETNQQKTVATPVALGLKAKMSKFQAREKLLEEITKLTGPSTGDDSVKNGAVTFGWFVRNRFYPYKRSALEGGNCQGEEAAHPAGPHRRVRGCPARKLR
jgi:hypothetical protein